MVWMQQLHGANWSQATWAFLCAYPLGCFVIGYYLVRVRTGQDIRLLGSGSVGAKNVGRVLGWWGFFVTVFCDVSKGALAVWVARHYTNDVFVVSLAMVSVVMGHIWPLQLRGHGGKGMATSIGSLLFFDYRLVVAFVFLFAIPYAALRRTVLPGLFAISCLPLVALYLAPDPSHSPGTVIGISVLAALVLMAHRKNLMEEVSRLVEQRRHAHPKHDRTKL
jgi:acyl-phosphate glycerol 3-phosphate acyltransferase